MYRVPNLRYPAGPVASPTGDSTPNPMDAMDAASAPRPALAGFLTACSSGDVAAVDALLRADPGLLTATDADGWSGLIHAAKDGRLAAVRELLRRGCPPDPATQGKHSALRGAAMAGHDDVVRALLDAGASPDVRSNGARTPLQGASRGGHTATVRLLLERGADPALRNSFGETALDVAATDEVRAAFAGRGAARTS